MPETEVTAGDGLANVLATRTVAATLYLIGDHMGANPDLGADSSCSGESLNASVL